MSDQITYDDKADLIVDTGIDDIFKVTASDMNQIKSVVNGNAEDVGDISTLTTTDKTSVVNAINELETDKLETSAVVNEASTETDEVYSSDYLNDKLVAVGAEAPENGERVWFKKSVNLFDASTIIAGDILGGNPTIRLSSRQVLWLEPGTYTFSTNQPSPFRFSLQVEDVGIPPLTAYPTYIYNSGWQTTSSHTFTLTSPGYIIVNISKNNNETLTLSEIANYNYQLQLGSSATSYEPYVDEGIYVDNEHFTFDNYSTSEQVIGKWIDDKPIYRKTYQVTNISSSNVDLVDVSSLNFDTIIKLYGFIRSQVGMSMPMPLTDSSSNYNVIFLSENKIRGRVAFGTGGSVKDCYVTIEYTKTTD